MRKKIKTVIDADGLWLVSQQPALVHGYLNCILTPNVAEFERLVEAVLRAEETSQEMRVALGEHGHDVYEFLETGSPRRCGGQGDLLAGSLAVALHWSNRTEKAIPWEGERPPSKNIVAGLLAATVVKKASAPPNKRCPPTPAPASDAQVIRRGGASKKCYSCAKFTPITFMFEDNKQKVWTLVFVSKIQYSFHTI
eukprot:gene2892-3154_t